MAVLDTTTPPSAATGLDRPTVKVGPIGRLGHYTATHFRVVLTSLAADRGGARVLRPTRRDRPLGRRAGRPPARSRSRRDS